MVEAGNVLDGLLPQRILYKPEVHLISRDTERDEDGYDRRERILIDT